MRHQVPWALALPRPRRQLRQSLRHQEAGDAHKCILHSLPRLGRDDEMRQAVGHRVVLRRLNHAAISVHIPLVAHKEDGHAGLGVPAQ